MLVPAVNVKGDLIVLIPPYFIHFNIFEAKALCDEYRALIYQDIF